MISRQAGPRPRHRDRSYHNLISGGVPTLAVVLTPRHMGRTGCSRWERSRAVGRTRDGTGFDSPDTRAVMIVCTGTAQNNAMQVQRVGFKLHLLSSISANLSPSGKTPPHSSSPSLSPTFAYATDGPVISLCEDRPPTCMRVITSVDHFPTGISSNGNDSDFPFTVARFGTTSRILRL